MSGGRSVKQGLGLRMAARTPCCRSRRDVMSGHWRMPLAPLDWESMGRGTLGASEGSPGSSQAIGTKAVRRGLPSPRVVAMMAPPMLERAIRESPLSTRFTSVSSAPRYLVFCTRKTRESSSPELVHFADLTGQFETASMWIRAGSGKLTPS